MGVVKAFQQFCGRGCLKICLEGVLDGKGGSGILEIIIIIFTSRILFDLLFTCGLKDVASLVIFHLRF